MKNKIGVYVIRTMEESYLLQEAFPGFSGTTH
jgi:hypothetical protein